MTFGEKLRNKRREMHLTQAQLGELLGYKNKHSGERVVQEYENNRRKPTLPNLQKLASALLCYVDDLLDDEEDVPNVE